MRRAGLAAVLVAVARAFVWAGPASAQQDPLPAELGYSVGDADAALHVIEFSDFGCGYCAQFAKEIWPRLEEEFVATGRVRWTYVPFRVVGFRHADEAAEAAECAGQQGKFWPMHERLFADRRAWSRVQDPAKVLLDHARAIGLDTAEFMRCIESREMRGRIHHNTSIARAMGARATPTFFVNDRRVEGALPYGRFREVLLRELEAPQPEARAPRDRESRTRSIASR